MLTHADEPTIRFALNRRLDKEPGTRVGEIKCTPHLKAEPPYTQVEAEIYLNSTLTVRTAFHLPEPFEHRHLLNEIDEIAESCKRARLDFWKQGQSMMGAHNELPGTGLRGRWSNYG